MLGFRFFRSRPTDYVLLFSSGRPRRKGLGLGGVIYTPTATAAAVPIDTRDDIFSVEAMTADYQTVTVQGQLTYRIAEPETAAARQDFAIDLKTGRHVGEPMKQVVERLRAIVQSACRDALVSSTLDAALNKAGDLSAAIVGTITRDTRIAGDGIAVDRVLVLSVKPAPEIRKALEAELREQLLRKADAAVFERRRAAQGDEHDLKVREEQNRRQLAETELKNQEALEAERKRVADARAATAKREAETDAESSRIRMKPWAEMPAAHIAAMGFKDWANRNTALQTLSVGGDVLTSLADALKGAKAG
ncbi:MAG TPA: SPFH domain-containing protein [Micropepsaceae bacterium]|nr:SPFH domain-containing protein [Micropepsaceae bacterium]